MKTVCTYTWVTPPARVKSFSVCTQHECGREDVIADDVQRHHFCKCKMCGLDQLNERGVREMERSYRIVQRQIAGS